MHNLTREELIRRITFISEDINKIYDRLQDMNVDTGTNKKGVSLDTYASNIMVVCDMDKDGNVDEDGHRVEDEWLSIDERNERNWDARKKPFDEIVETLKELDVDGEMMQGLHKCFDVGEFSLLHGIHSSIRVKPSSVNGHNWHGRRMSCLRLLLDDPGLQDKPQYLAHICQQLHTHAFLETIGVSTANGQDPSPAFSVQRHHDGRGNVIPIIAEQEHLLLPFHAATQGHTFIDDGFKQGLFSLF